MKKVAAAIMILLVTFSVAFAEWLVDFRNIYFEVGIDDAVEAAVSEGATPDMIVENGLQLDGLTEPNLIKALYCAGARGKDIKRAAEKWKIDPFLVTAGYKRSLTECGDNVADSQAFTAAGTGTNFVSVNPTGGTTPASPTGFAQ